MVSLLAGLALVASPDWWIAFGLVGVAGCTAFGLIQPALFLGLFLAIRPLLDQFSTVTAGVPSANVAGALGSLLVAITVVALAVRKGRFSVPTAVPLVAVALVSIVAAAQATLELGSVIGLNSVSELVRLAALLALFLLAANITTTVAKARSLFVIVAMSAVIPALYGMYELVAGVAPSHDTEDVARISGTFTGPVPFGAFLAFAALITMFGPMQKVPGWVRWPALALMLVGLTESFSRVGWVTLILGVGIMAWPHQKRLVATFVILVIGLIMVVPSVRERALPLGNQAPTAQSSAAGYESYGWRIQNWGGLLDKWSQKPLLGYGLQTTQFVNPRSPASSVGVVGGGFEAHNMLVRILVEGGVVLLLVYLAYFAAMLRRMWRLSRRRWALAEESRLLLVVWGLTLFTGATTDDPFTLTAVMGGLLALSGAVEGAWRTLPKEEIGAGEAPYVPTHATPGRARPAVFWRPEAPGSGVR
jgi:O-antigen ligase